ncbi:MAG: hypothetical protein CSB55_04785 [Candidatus Cloacimonadota bacterium]|nr:MAG: hypothetical protein CSB55_04785 [Candidatus Cloacimonadota bacterium]
MKKIILPILIAVSLHLNAIEKKYENKINELKIKLIDKGVPEKWFNENIQDSVFKIYASVPKYFKTSPEKKVSTRKKSHDWYLRYFAVDKKAELADNFIKKYKKTLLRAENKFGIHYEIVVAILGMETNFASKRQRGHFYTFSTLVSQYVLLPKRERFATNELTALYKFSNKIKKPSDYFIGSFAGAAGWGQFIPTSMEHYFIDENGIPEETDIYSVEDNIFSIANYLVKNGLKPEKMDDYKNRFNAVRSYNHSDSYAKATLYIYDKLRAKRESEKR